MQKEYQLVRLKAHGHNFEIATKPGSVLKFKKGALGWDDVLLADDVFKNFSKAEKASEADLKEVFGTTNPIEAAKQIVDKGELHLSAAERKEFLDKRRAQIVNYIHKYYIDPKAKTPHPITRIENALDELKVRIDLDTPLDKQIDEIARRLPEVIAIKKQEVEGALTIPHAWIGAASGILTKYCTVKGESYDAAGCKYNVSLAPGDYDGLLADLNRVTKGDYQFEIEGASMAATNEDASEKKGKGGGGKRGGKGGKK